jgi:FKBP-type peptidyl-prolyl cis-trans isomerase FkpA
MTLPFVRTRARVAIASLVALGAFSACSLATTEPTPTDPANVTFDVATGVNLGTMTKVSAQLYTKDSVVGTGRTVVQGDSIEAYYNGRLTGGFSFDSRARPATVAGFRLDTNTVVNGVFRPGVIGGWIQGISGMKVGGIRKLVIGPTLAYGLNTVRDGVGNLIIPANSVLVFDVEVVNAIPRP